MMNLYFLQVVFNFRKISNLHQKRFFIVNLSDFTIFILTFVNSMQQIVPHIEYYKATGLVRRCF